MRDKLHKFVSHLFYGNKEKCQILRSLQAYTKRNIFRNHYRMAIKTAKQNANSNYITNSSNISKATWTVINSNCSFNKRSITDSNLTANELNIL